MTCYIMDKSEKNRWLPRLFDLLYGNMSEVAPGMLPYQLQRQRWMEEVAPALDKEPRQILLCSSGEELVGYIQYYTRDTVLVVEEVQLLRKYQGTLAFLYMCRSLSSVLPCVINWIEAYADKRNFRSCRIMEKLGLREILHSRDEFLHYSGSARRAKVLFKGNS